MIRLATRADGLIENRSAVRENHLSDPSRVTFADYHWFIDHAGVHVWYDGGLIKDLSAGDPRDGSIWALFVDPAFEAWRRESPYSRSLRVAGHRIATQHGGQNEGRTLLIWL